MDVIVSQRDNVLAPYFMGPFGYPYKVAKYLDHDVATIHAIGEYSKDVFSSVILSYDWR